MAKERIGCGDGYEVAMAGPPQKQFYDGAEVIAAPRMIGEAACYGPGSDGKPEMLWSQGMSNLVVNQGRALIQNRLFASWTSYNNAALFLHSAALGSNSVWTNISASQVVSYGNNIPIITFATSQTTAGDSGHNSISASASYAFTASTQTLSGAGILFYTTNTMSTNFASSDGRLYCYGSFTASQVVQNANTLSATITVSFSSA